MSSIDGEIRIVVIHDHVLFRQGVAEMLSTDGEIKVVGECGDSDSRSMIDRLKPDIAIWGPDKFGLRAEEALREMLAGPSETKIVIITIDEDDPRLIADMITAGADACILKNSTREELIRVVRRAHQNSSQVLLPVPRETLQGLNGHVPQVLSAREYEVLTLVAAGMRNSQIAAQLYISQGTVKRHLTNIYTKLDAVSRVDAIKKAVSLNLISVNDIFRPDSTFTGGKS